MEKKFSKIFLYSFITLRKSWKIILWISYLIEFISVSKKKRTDFYILKNQKVSFKNNLFYVWVLCIQLKTQVIQKIFTKITLYVFHLLKKTLQEILCFMVFIWLVIFSVTKKNNKDFKALKTKTFLYKKYHSIFIFS